MEEVVTIPSAIFYRKTPHSVRTAIPISPPTLSTVTTVTTTTTTTQQNSAALFFEDDEEESVVSFVSTSTYATPVSKNNSGKCGKVAGTIVTDQLKRFIDGVAIESLHPSVVDATVLPLVFHIYSYRANYGYDEENTAIEEIRTAMNQAVVETGQRRVLRQPQQPLGRPPPRDISIAQRQVNQSYSNEEESSGSRFDRTAHTTVASADGPASFRSMLLVDTKLLESESAAVNSNHPSSSGPRAVVHRAQTSQGAAARGTAAVMNHPTGTSNVPAVRKKSRSRSKSCRENAATAAAASGDDDYSDNDDDDDETSKKKPRRSPRFKK